MSWAKLDDQYPDHPKIVEVGPLGMALHVAATCYCSKYLTDGFVPSAMIPRLICLDGITVMRNGVSNAVTNKEITDDLIRVGLFERVDGGVMVHDYLEYNPKSEEVKAARAENAKRQKEWRDNHKGKDGKFISNGQRNALLTPNVTPPPSPSPSPSPSPTHIIKDLKPLSAQVREPKVVDERSKHPAILTFKEIVKRYPAKDLFDRVIEYMGDTPDKGKALDCRVEWLARGYNANSIGWLDWYSKGIPHKNGFKPEDDEILTGPNGEKRRRSEL